MRRGKLTRIERGQSCATRSFNEEDITGQLTGTDKSPQFEIRALNLRREPWVEERWVFGGKKNSRENKCNFYFD
jgi:hypothetical protein